LRDQHVATVDVAEAFLSGSMEYKFFLDKVKYSLDVHFVLEDEVLIPTFRPILRKFLEFEEPPRIIVGEHNSIRSSYRSVANPVVFETDEAIRSTEEEIIGKCGTMAKTLLQHVYKEENGLFSLIEQYMPDDLKDDVSQKIKEKLPVLEAAHRNAMK
jgi:hemerythrin-like domain-containing protein